MKYYHLHIDQQTYCGIYEDIYMEAENIEKVEKFAELNAYDILSDYFFDEDEESEGWEEGIIWDIEEITKEEYEENR